jgi:HlyD family secretion protein
MSASPKNKPNRTKRRIGVTALAALIAIGAFSFFPRGGDTQVSTGSLITVGKTDIRSTTSAGGTIQPARQVALSFPVIGRITEVNVIAGGKVKAGTVIARIDDTNAALEVETRTVAVEEATAKYESVRQGVSAADLAANEASAAQARSQVSVASDAAVQAASAASATAKQQRSAVKLAEAQAKRDAALVTAETNRLATFNTRLVSAQAKRDEAKTALDAAKLRVTTVTQKRDAARVSVDTARQEAARLALVRDDAQRALDKATADYEKLRSLSPGGTNPDGMIVVPVLPPDNAVVAARTTATATARAATAAESEILKAQSALESAVDELAQAERDLATAQGKLDTAEANITTATANVDATEPRIETATEQARKSADTAAAARATLAATISKENQSVAAARGQTRTARENAKVVAAENQKRAQGPKAADLAAAKAAIKAAEVQLKVAQDQLSRYTLKAPFDGVISQVGVKIGEQAGTTAAPAGTSATAAASATSAAFTLLEETGLYVRVGFPEVDASRIVDGATTTVTFEALPGAKVTGRVVSVEPTATLVNGVSTYFARVELDEQPKQVRIGMNANVEVLLGVNTGALTVPANALHQVNGETYVKVAETVEGKIKTVERVVEIGVRSDGQVEIAKGLSAGDQIQLPLDESTKTTKATTGTK